jgi:DNA-binding LacI/PurR family transcriptional regulator
MADNKINSFDIAARAGVSQSTVSRALRNSPLVSKETRELVQTIAREMNYIVDKSAANLRTKTSQTIALLIFEDDGPNQQTINPFFLSMLGSVTRAASDQGYDLLVSFQKLQENWHREYEAAHRADGLILLGYGNFLDYQNKLDELSEAQAQFIMWGPAVDGQTGVSIGCDNYLGGYEATKHLIQQGRTQIAFIGDHQDDAPEFKLRLQGYLEAHKDAGLSVNQSRVCAAGNREEDGVNAIEHLRRQAIDFDAVFTASDLIAIGAINALKQHNIAIPKDVAVIGFDDIPAASYINPPLTSVRQDTKLAGELLVDRLIQSIKGEEIHSELIKPSLVLRASCV